MALEVQESEQRLLSADKALCHLNNRPNKLRNFVE